MYHNDGFPYQYNTPSTYQNPQETNPILNRDMLQLQIDQINQQLQRGGFYERFGDLLSFIVSSEINRHPLQNSLLNRSRSHNGGLQDNQLDQYSHYTSPHQNYFKAEGHDLSRQRMTRPDDSGYANDNPFVSDKTQLQQRWLQQIKATIELVKTLLTAKTSEQEIRINVQSRYKKIEADYHQNVRQLEKVMQERKNIENDKEKILNQMKVMESKFKDAIEKTNLEKDELSKQIKLVMSKDNHSKNQFRKLEHLNKNLTEKLTKQQQQQERVQYKNSFEILQNVSTNPPSVICSNAESQFHEVTLRAVEESHNNLVRENTFYKECLTNLYRQLNIIMEIKKEAISRRRGADTQIEQYFELQPFRPEALTLGHKNAKNALEQLSQNIQRFKEAIKVGDVLEGKHEEEKNKCVGSVKQMLKNYRSIVQSQDQLLNKVILRAKQFKSVEIGAIQNRYLAGENGEDEIFKAKRFIEEQSQYLESRQRQLSLTRQAMHDTLRRAEEERAQAERRRREFNDETERLKRTFEEIPRIIQGTLID